MEQDKKTAIMATLHINESDTSSLYSHFSSPYTNNTLSYNTDVSHSPYIIDSNTNSLDSNTNISDDNFQYQTKKSPRIKPNPNFPNLTNNQYIKSENQQFLIEAIKSIMSRMISNNQWTLSITDLSQGRFNEIIKNCGGIKEVALEAKRLFLLHYPNENTHKEWPVIISMFDKIGDTPKSQLSSFCYNAYRKWKRNLHSNKHSNGINNPSSPDININLSGGVENINMDQQVITDIHTHTFPFPITIPTINDNISNGINPNNIHSIKKQKIDHDI